MCELRRASICRVVTVHATPCLKCPEIIKRLSLRAVRQWKNSLPELWILRHEKGTSVTSRPTKTARTQQNAVQHVTARSGFRVAPALPD